MDTISVDVTLPVAYALLERAGFTKDERDRWRHEDGRWAWQTDEALQWALDDLAEEHDHGLTVRRTAYTIVYEHTDLRIVLAEATRCGRKWHTCRYHPIPDGPGLTEEYDEWDDRASATRVASSHAQELARAI
ncbi:MAG: hypothetical protein ABR992_02265 [Solirubrobacteraceae bacterium]